MPTRLIELVEHLPSAKIVLVGDLMLDRYIYGNAEQRRSQPDLSVVHQWQSSTRRDRDELYHNDIK